MAISVTDKNLGVATAYGYAKSKGYTGTEEEFAELMASYGTVAQEAQQSAEDAAQSAQEAQGFVTLATEQAQASANSASESAGSASTASTKAQEASASATNAAQSATQAAESATSASISASNASQSASTASTKASEASTSASNAATSASNASSRASDASASATAAAGSATQAASSASDAAKTATSISESAEQIETNKNDITNLKQDLLQMTSARVKKPLTSPDGMSGQLLRTLGDGNTEWVNQGLPTDEQTAEAVTAWLNEHPEATTTVQDGAITYTKLSDLVKIGVTCSALGMTENDSNGENANILASAINTGKTILVDGVYQLSYDSPFEITSNVIMQGITQDAGFVSSNSSTLFTPSGVLDVYLCNVRFTNTDINDFMLFYVAPENATDVLFHNFIVSRCSFVNTGSGTLKLIDYRTVASTQPQNTFGVDRFVFDGNRLDTVRGMFITFIGQPIRWAEITRNNIHNHNSVLFYCAIENMDEYDLDIKKSRRMLIVRNNYTKNDLDYWCTVIANNYNCITVFEGYKSIIDGNHTEGIHAENNCTMIPFYNSCQYLTYTNNEFVDNAVFSDEQTPESSSLFRCKGVGTHANYSRNTFIIHDDFAENVGKSGFEITHTLLLEGIETGTVEITNNYIDVQSLAGMNYGCSNKSLNFSNNTVHAKNWTEKAFYTISPDASKVFVFRNNKFTFETYGKDSGSETCYLVYGGNYSGDLSGEQLDTFIAKDNFIHFGEIGFKKLCLFRNIHANAIDISGNRFESSGNRIDISTDNKELFSTKLITLNNAVISGIPIVQFQRRDGGSFSSSDLNCIIESINSTKYTGSDIILPVNTITTDGESISIMYKIEIVTDIVQEYAFTLKYGKSNGAETITVVKADGTSEVIDPSSLESNYQDVRVFDATIIRSTWRILKTGVITGTVAQLRFTFTNYPTNTITKTHIYVKHA